VGSALGSNQSQMTESSASTASPRGCKPCPAHDGWWCSTTALMNAHTAADDLRDVTNDDGTREQCRICTSKAVDALLGIANREESAVRHLQGCEGCVRIEDSVRLWILSQEG
jgi:hypothetical protein